MDADAEIATIGALLVAPGQLPAVSRIVQPSHFLRPLMREMYAAMLRMYAAGTPIDPVTLDAELRGVLSHEEYQSAGPWLVTAIERAPNAYRADHYAQIVFRAAKRRELIAAAGEVVTWAFDDSAPFDGMTTAALRIFEQIDNHRSATESGHIDEALARLRAPQKRGLSFHVPLFDTWFGGMVPKRLMVIAGPTGSGKTWLQGSMVNAALKQGASVAEFSLEMPKQHRVARLAANMWGGKAMRLARPAQDWTEEDIEMYDRAAEFYRSVPIRIYEDQRSLDDITAILRTNPPDVAVIDYYQALRWPEGAKSEYEADRVLANRLFELAQSSGVFLVVLSQKNQVAIRAGTTDAALGLKGATILGDRCDHLLDLYQTDETAGGVPMMDMAASKNRWGPNRAAGAMAKFVFDKSRGHLLSLEDWQRLNYVGGIAA